MALTPAADGIRMDPNAHTFEWWYFDAHLDDGSTAVVSYNTKEPTKLSDPLTPTASMTITRPDGSEWTHDAIAPAAEFQASKERCDVKMGACWARGDLHTYTIHAEGEGNSIDLTFTGVVPAWTPDYGDTTYFDAEKRKVFGWVPSIPFGTVSGTLTYDGVSHQVSGTGYHDHNWGNVPMQDGISHWYWGRAHVGDYSTIFVTVYYRPQVAEATGIQIRPIFLLAKGDQILTGQGEAFQMVPSEMRKTPAGMEYPTKIDASWQTEAGHAGMSVTNPKIIEADDLLASIPSWVRWLVKWFSNPYYLRFNADISLSFDINGVKGEAQGKTLFELMSFE